MSKCSKCGADKVALCPDCGQPVEVYSRIVGYFRPVVTWNDGKAQEFNDRVNYTFVGGEKIDNHGSR